MNQLKKISIAFLFGIIPYTSTFAQTCECLTDAQAAGVVKTINEGEIAMGTLAPARTKDAEVISYAAMLVTDHSVSNRDLLAWSNATGIAPAPSVLSETLAAEAKKMVAELYPLAFKKFDVAFAQAAITAHQNALDIVDNKLLPNAKDPGLIALLQKNRPIIVHHLEEALLLKEKLED